MGRGWGILRDQGLLRVFTAIVMSCRDNWNEKHRPPFAAGLSKKKLKSWRTTAVCWERMQKDWFKKMPVLVFVQSVYTLKTSAVERWLISAITITWLLVPGSLIRVSRAWRGRGRNDPIQDGGTVSSGVLLPEEDTQRDVIITSATTAVPGNNMGCVPDWQP